MALTARVKLRALSWNVFIWKPTRSLSITA